ncbi:DNA-directed RNA polymerase subunit beta [Candidatus Similichlamydia laticola]|uniref:DNA-directed RNA polymerase subunit beta n=1 Tax=Candidatus Similichlamydia laticola TaxID=2170265 RepID=A0A369KG77_9BACT|nr:DNA-directed RNA polymerase subunit beta [Candidatus Similichlamydia laticola]RDB31705.1 DNA-directed RNA polymerase beta subunit [Candidatus Similichlamydia laticola]
MLKKAPHRIGFREREEVIDLPNLLEVQIKSYQEFLQAHLLPHERQNVGLQEVFNEAFPIKSHDEKVVLEFISYSLGVPKHTPEECIRRGITYNVTLRVKLRSTDETGIKEEEVYMGTLPVMTEKGTFVINGAERVIVSQLHRSPGISFESVKHPKGFDLFLFRIIPYRGSWLEAGFDANDLIHIYIDRKKRRRKILATTFIRTLGYSTDADIIEEFFPTQYVSLSSEELTRCIGQVLAEDVLDESNGQLLGKAGEKLTTAMLKKMLDAKIPNIKIAEDANELSPIIKMLAKDTAHSYEVALKQFYRKIRPGEPTTLANARAAMVRLFFDPRRYNLGRVGRYKINKKLGRPINDETLQEQTLSKEDLVLAIKYLLRIRNGDSSAAVDDIDHLANRRVRSVGELIQNQCRVGLARMEKIIRERINLFDFSGDTMTPSKVVSAKSLSGVLRDFFGRSQLSQFMDQANPLAELTHKRRLSSLGPGGLNRDRAGFEVRDVHTSHYGRICPIETPEGPNIGLITSLSSYAKINEFGFIETPYRVVRDGVVTNEIEYMTVDAEEKCVIAQASAEMDEYGCLLGDYCWGRHLGESLEVSVDSVTHMDVSPKQLVSIATGLIPFLEHDDANRSLMGSNMQRQAVPLVKARSPIVGTGLEAKAARDSGAVVIAQEDGYVEYVDALKIVVRSKDNALQTTDYQLKKFMRSNAGTCINQKPLCEVGDEVFINDVIADGPATEAGEMALGSNVLVGFMPWCGFNFEDAIVVSEELLHEDAYTSYSFECFVLEARDTKLGEEEITRDIPNVSEEALANLDEDGIVRLGSEVKPGDILVGKIAPKSETELAPEERLLRAIFGEKAADVKDASLLVPPGTEGVVMDVRIFNRRDRLARADEDVVEEASRFKDIQKSHKAKISGLRANLRDRLGALLLGETAPESIFHRKTGEVLFAKGAVFNQASIELLENQEIDDLLIAREVDLYSTMREVLLDHRTKLMMAENQRAVELEVLKKGDSELDTDVIRQVKVYVASKRKLQVGDKMAGRHGNKGVVAKIVPVNDMPYIEETGRPLHILLNPLGVPSRMNIGQLLETHLGYAAYLKDCYVRTPVFEGFPEKKIWEMVQEAGLPSNGKLWLSDGRTGERFYNPVVVGIIYMLKLGHMVDDKIHSRGVGPYSLVTQQPLGGKAQMGGQRFGEMEVWAVEAYGASYLLQEILTVKSDDVAGRTLMYQSIVKGENVLRADFPESFNVLFKELRGLGLNVSLQNIVSQEGEVVTSKESTPLSNLVGSDHYNG